MPVAETNREMILFDLDGQRFGIELRQVQRVVRAVAITPVPGAPATVLGLLNIGGTVIPVMNMRRILHRPERELQLSDQLLIVHTADRVVALLVDGVLGVYGPRVGGEVPLDTILPGNGLIRGVLRDQGDLIFIQDVDAFLSASEIEIFDSASEQHPGVPRV
ncbi:CheW protein [Methanosphaerula palustris E1-9c]|uniref:CheW protein n=2 Tax=Methanosphaerula palustris TaxID=475088 RepID=B8GHQ3_METPE|nr:CheW protein [Methanosphaerula palustris E1-9c]